MQVSDMSNEKWYCPECGAQNSGDFCTVCGAMRKKDESFTCACGNVFTGNFCPECGSPRPQFRSPADMGCRSLADTEKKVLTGHGWRDDSGRFKAVLKDGNLISSYTASITDGEEDTLLIDTEYKFSLQELGMVSMAYSIQKLEHPDEDFIIYPRDVIFQSEGKNLYQITKLWYGSGTLHVDLKKCGSYDHFTLDLVLDDTVSIAPSEPAPAIGWTCSKCGKENQTGEFCEECGEAIKKVVLFSCSSYHSTNPPRYEGVTVYEFSDTELICMFYTNGKSRSRYISKDVIDPALNIIKEYGIDKWKDYENTNTYLMGGSVSIMYRDRDELVGSSLEHMGFAVSGAYSKLMALFNIA
jgi:hypothetical protein